MPPIKKINLVIMVLIVLVSIFLSAGTQRGGSKSLDAVYLPGVFNSYIKGLTNPGFEYGSQGWVVQTNQGDEVITLAAAHTGIRSAGLGNGAQHRVTAISQKIDVPQSAWGIRYYQLVEFQDGCPDLNVIINSEIYKHYICKPGDKGNWIIQDLGLEPSLRGATIDFKLQFQSSDMDGVFLYVDDFGFLLE